MKRDPGIDVWTIWIYLILWTVQLNVVKTVIALLCVIYHTHKNPTTSSLPMGLSAVYTLCRTQRSCYGKTTHIFRQPSGLETWKRVCVYTCLAIVAGVVLNPVTYSAVPLLPSTDLSKVQKKKTIVCPRAMDPGSRKKRGPGILFCKHCLILPLFNHPRKSGSAIILTCRVRKLWLKVHSVTQDP